MWTCHLSLYDVLTPVQIAYVTKWTGLFLLGKFIWGISLVALYKIIKKRSLWSPQTFVMTVQTSFHYLQRCIKSLLFQILTVCGRLGCWLVSASWFCERSSTKGRWHACLGRCLLLVQSSPWNRHACHTPSLQDSQSLMILFEVVFA